MGSASHQGILQMFCGFRVQGLGVLVPGVCRGDSNFYTGMDLARNGAARAGKPGTKVQKYARYWGLDFKISGLGCLP